MIGETAAEAKAAEETAEAGEASEAAVVMVALEETPEAQAEDRSRCNPTHSCHATMHTVGGPALASRAHAALCDAHREHASLSNGARAAPAFIVLGARTAVVAKSVDG